VKVLFRFDASGTLMRRVAALSGEGIEVLCCPEAEDAEYQRLLPQIDVLWHVLKPVTAEHLERAKRLKLVQKIGSGVNTIAVDFCKAKGIAVCNLPGTNSRAVAEMTLLLMLACLRRLPELNLLLRQEQGWGKAWALQDRFGELAGRSVGLVGYGAVPQILAPILHAMGASVRYWSRSQKNAELDALVARSDIVSLHLPLTAETRGIVDPRRMKRRAILINTARGGLVDQDLLLEQLTNGHLAAAGLDAYAEEPIAPDHPLLSLRNVICAPHLAWLTQETLERGLAAALQNVKLLKAGAPLENRVA
jgi:phosphoglycerate dehydrogenase-like enzyme